MAVFVQNSKRYSLTNEYELGDWLRVTLYAYSVFVCLSADECVWLCAYVRTHVCICTCLCIHKQTSICAFNTAGL